MNLFQQKHCSTFFFLLTKEKKKMNRNPLKFQRKEGEKKIEKVVGGVILHLTDRQTTATTNHWRK